jgi:glycosyltransferase involved in cell wall biosynthesis
MPLRIAIDVRHIRDFGFGTYIRNLVQALATIDRENDYILIAHEADLHNLEALDANFETAVYRRHDSQEIDNIAFPWFVRGLGVDLCHIPIARVPVFMTRPYVVTVHDLSSILFMQETGARGSLRLFRTRRGLSRANKVIVVSAATRREVENLVEIPPERIRQVHGAPDPIFLERSRNPEVHALEKQRTLERYQINYPFLLYAGAIRPQKNIPRLVEAFAVLRGDLERHPAYKDLRLLIIGDEISRHPAVRRTVIQTRMEDFVRFLGFVPTDTLRIIYETAAAFVFPSLYEGFGLPPLEAMACGTPVVTSNTSSLPEVVGAAAVLVKPENVFDIARGMREVLLDNELRARLVEKGYEQVKRFSWERTAREVLEVYGEVGRGK